MDAWVIGLCLIAVFITFVSLIESCLMLVASKPLTQDFKVYKLESWRDKRTDIVVAVLTVAAHVTIASVHAVSVAETVL